MLKLLKESDGFLDGVALNWSNTFLKIRLFKFLSKFTMLKNSTLPTSCFKTNFKTIWKICNEDQGIFGKKDSSFENPSPHYQCRLKLWDKCFCYSSLLLVKTNASWFFIHSGEFYLVWRIFSLTKQQTRLHSVYWRSLNRLKRVYREKSFFIRLIRRKCR